ncbi:polyphosphate kinase [Halosimplex carlsbadense 2-9-1]|uniref:Polyphosphate kinase n=1 Tax=Halosimplex carlsbadense 2-9-1 TaxID=797114 RepID=M0D245_9EURY|nr:polyphosphate kinase 1 [Halosimplex carlsbadense]ELZ28928.1 polyphosphate kinase [Halosimplex carlsbadense 2-9-1]
MPTDNSDADAADGGATTTEEATATDAGGQERTADANDEATTPDVTADGDARTVVVPEAAGAETVDAEAGFDRSDPAFYLNRELSELAYQRRVLHEAIDERNPLLERVRFLSIFTRNMDEFFMKRVGGLKQQIEAGVTERTVDGRTPAEQWEAVLDAARPMFARQTDCYESVVRPALADAGIHVLDYDDLSADERAAMRDYFERSVLPTLTPLAFDPAHPFPFISNLSLSLAVITRETDGDGTTFTRVKIPQNLPRLVEVVDGERYVPIEDVIRANLDLLFPNVEVVEASLFRLTRNAEVRRDEEVAEDLIDMIEEVLEQRRFATVVRLEVEAGMSERARTTLVEQLDLDEREVFEQPGPLDYREFTRLLDLDRPELKLPEWTPQPHPRLQRERTPLGEAGDETDIFSRIREDDILLHHPYHSFTDTVQRFLAEAAADPDVLAIKAAIYRTASDSQVIQSLIDAADNGKQVAVMVELKARFDEQNNLEWVRRLEENGIHVAYGTVGLKTHTKTALVVREEDDGVELYSHVSTGNYHSETAKGYVDLGLLTADRDIGQDLVKVFNFFTGPSLDEQFRKLLIAPVTMRDRLTEYVRREADHAREDREARIVAKVNALEDPDLVAELYEAGMAGVDVDLIVRDICRLRPGIEGVSENVDVYSVVGRFLEHSRIYYFENGARDPDLPADAPGGHPEYYIGSADWMTRNLDSRVEAVAPVEDPDIREQLRFVLELVLSDNRKRWEMNADGTYEQRQPDPGEPEISTQEVLMDQARRAATDDDVDRGIPADAFDETDLLVDAVGRDSGRPAEDDASAETGDSDDDGLDAGGSANEATDSPEAPVDGDGPTTVVEPDGSGSAVAANGDLPAALSENPDAWYRPDSDHYAFAVRTPDETVYRKTAEGAASAVERYRD